MSALVLPLSPRVSLRQVSESLDFFSHEEPCKSRTTLSFHVCRTFSGQPLPVRHQAALVDQVRTHFVPRIERSIVLYHGSEASGLLITSWQFLSDSHTNVAGSEDIPIAKVAPCSMPFQSASDNLAL